MLHPKFIIEGDSLIIGKCTFHKDLASDIKDVKDVKGGGFYFIKRESKTFYLSGESHDFGMAKIEDIRKCIESNKVYTNKYSGVSIAEDFKFIYRNQIGEEQNLN